MIYIINLTALMLDLNGIQGLKRPRPDNMSMNSFSCKSFVKGKRIHLNDYEGLNFEDSTSLDDYDFQTENFDNVPHFFANTQKPITLTLPYEKNNQMLQILHMQRSFRNQNFNDSNEFQNNRNLVDDPKTVQRNYQIENQRLQLMHHSRLSRQLT